MSDPGARTTGAGAGDSRLWTAVAALEFALAAWLRVRDAVQYPRLFGFDAIQNWRYIERLVGSWALPEPDADWSTAHPPLFYYASAALVRALRALGLEDAALEVTAVRLMGALAGLIAAAMVHGVVRGPLRGSRRRAALALGLVLLVPAHVMLSAMVSEEVLAASFSTGALALLVRALSRAPDPDAPRAQSMRRRLVLGAGLCAGLALATKLSGALVIAAGALALAVDGIWRAQARAGLRQAAAFAALAALVGGGFYARNLLVHGYLYPQSLDTHAVMFWMPPGERSLLDYVRFPLATFTRNEAIDPDLLRSVWGGTYASYWFDAHRKFLPLESEPGGEWVRRLGTAMLVLALLPTAAFLAGFATAARRALRERASIDLLLCTMTLLTLAGYALFTWRNPWYATVKGSFLLSLGLPVAVQASEALERWIARDRRLAALLLAALAALAALVVLVFGWGLLFAKQGFSGVIWQPVVPR